MVIQDNSSVSVSADTGVHSISGEGHVPKIRKPYTITKQRERWTEEEHKKFLEAFKLYGRAWRKIEEHVWSKTIVQIRSHAQKFFCKVARETSDVNSSTVEPIEIPPPRPKRKPMHPYPRKLALNAGKESQMEQRARSTSPHSSLSELDNRSPTSGLSTVISDTPPSEDGTMPNGSPPPISSDEIHRQAEDEEHLKQADVQKLELFPNICTIDGKECTAGKVLKLFGKNLVIPSKSSNSSTHTSKSHALDNDEGVVESSIENRLVDIEMTNFDSSRNHFDGGDNSKDGNSIQVEKPIPLPWWVLYRDTAIPPFGCNETQVEESCDGSNSGSVNDEADTTMNWDAEAQLGRCAPQADKDNKSFDNPNPSLLERKTSFHKIGKGFVPYKRCFSDRDMQSSTITSDDGESQRIRLCL